MQFIIGGPDIPDALLQAHEEGRVVFFCGAGISYPAGLPGFGGLVEEVYRRTGTVPTEIEQAALDRHQYDASLDLLERRMPGQRLDVRRAIAESLQPNFRRKGAVATHAALLRLGRARKGALRLVTTNFDRVFHAAARRLGEKIQIYSAPMLPIPKNSRWDGLVFLHGLMPKELDEKELNRLVVTSGDFGLAYLTERWAARFVSELFRNYVVCFVGYSINDPVLRYMMDALAADRLLGEVTPQAWALGDCELGQESSKTIEWEAKGVTPILYNVASGSHDHSLLHRTLTSWSETYRDGVTGKERIVVTNALARPSASTKQDDFVGRTMWALSDPSGLPASRFADFDPVPALDWLLEAFASDRYGHADLVRFGVPPRDETDDKLGFSLTHRPAPYSLAAPMLLVSGGHSESRWDDVMFQIGRWLVRHLNDPRLILWIAERGGRLSDQWRSLIERRLDELSQLERAAKAADLAEISAQAPNAIPGPAMRALWRLLLSGKIKAHWQAPDLYQWRSRLERDGLTTASRLELRELLAPKVQLSAPFVWGDDQGSTEEWAHEKHPVDWELVLACNEVHSILIEDSFDQWQIALPALVDDLQMLLRDALDLRRELGGFSERSDRSHWDLPSIEPHWQNRGFHDWVVLIELLRDAWLVVRSVDEVRAARVAMAWFELPYPTFKRLAMFAASQKGCVPPESWAEWLLADDGLWLWAEDVHREVMRLLVLQGGLLPMGLQIRLENAILLGPPRDESDGELPQEGWKRYYDRSVWRRLAKLEASGLTLGATALQKLQELLAAHPTWCFEPHQQEEFLHWSSGTGDPDFELNSDVDIAPRNRRDLAQWLSNDRPERGPLHEDTWRDVCRSRFFHCLGALCDLARCDIWPTGRWREALQVWSEDGMVSRSWRFAAPLLQSMPEAVMEDLVHSVTWWLEAASKSAERHQPILVHMCRRVLNLSLDGDSGVRGGDGERLDQPVTEAINHPVGHVTQALFNLWFKRSPGDSDRLPDDICALFTLLCDVGVHRFRHGRVLLASRLITLFRVDPSWAKQYLLPRFDWSADPAEAKAMWEGFLWSPRLYEPLLLAFKSQFLGTAGHYDELGRHARQFAAILTYAALGSVDGYSAEEWRTALSNLPQKGLRESAQALVQALEGAGEQREEYWSNRVYPFWRDIWPKARGMVTPQIGESLARLSIAAGSEFPAALDVVVDWLRPIDHPSHLIRRLYDSGVCGHYPFSALRLLSKVVGNQSRTGPELGQCLELIKEAEARLAENLEYQHLREHARRTGL